MHGRYSFLKSCASVWLELVDEYKSVKAVAVRFNQFVSKTNRYRKGVLKIIRKQNKKLFTEIVNDKETVCLNNYA